MNPKILSQQLLNIGPVFAERLIKIGVDTPEKLKALGAIDTYELMIKNKILCGRYHASYIYALHGAIIGCKWNELPPADKERIKNYTKSKNNELKQKDKK